MPEGIVRELLVHVDEECQSPQWRSIVALVMPLLGQKVPAQLPRYMEWQLVCLLAQQNRHGWNFRLTLEQELRLDVLDLNRTLQDHECAPELHQAHPKRTVIQSQSS
jgi:hypothetical protein